MRVLAEVQALQQLLCQDRAVQVAQDRRLSCSLHDFCFRSSNSGRFARYLQCKGNCMSRHSWSLTYQTHDFIGFAVKCFFCVRQAWPGLR